MCCQPQITFAVIISPNHHSLQDYSVSQTTLDDVFIHFANSQSEEVGIINGMVDLLPDIVPLGPPEHAEISQTLTATQL